MLVWAPLRTAIVGLAMASGSLLCSSCGSTAETRTTPTGASPRCGVQMQAETLAFTPDGGTGTLRIVANRECGWTARSEAPWVTLSAPASGQGEGSVQFAVAAYGDPTARTTGITVDDQRLQVSQQGRSCLVRLSSAVESVDALGGERTIHVDASSALCEWSATADVPWITVVSGHQGKGSGAVGVRVEKMTGPARSGTITVAGQVVQFEQAQGCAFSVSAETFALGAAGGTRDLQVSASAGCGWTAQSRVPWITVTGSGTGSGSGAVAFHVAETDGPARTGTIVVATRVVTVSQNPGCTFVVNPLTHSIAAPGGTGTLTVRAAPGCTWTAATSSDWIAFNAGQAGSGDGELRFTVAANTGPARTGAVNLAGQTVTVAQAAGCTFAFTPATISVGAAPNATAVQVAAPSGCAWRATTTAPWVLLGDIVGGTGNGQVEVSFAANTGPARQASLTIADRTIPVTQANGCTYAVSPAAHDIAGSGGSGAATIATGANCPWLASSNAAWITLTSQAGAGPGQVPFTVAANPSPARTGTVTIGDRVFTVNQASLCTWSFSPPYHSFTAGGGNGNVLLIMSGSCSWTATSNVEWIVLTAGGSGTGGGLIQFIAAPNAGAARTGSLTIAGQRYDVVQDGR